MPLKRIYFDSSYKTHDELKQMIVGLFNLIKGKNLTSYDSITEKAKAELLECDKNNKLSHLIKILNHLDDIVKEKKHYRHILYELRFMSGETKCGKGVSDQNDGFVCSNEQKFWSDNGCVNEINSAPKYIAITVDSGNPHRFVSFLNEGKESIVDIDKTRHIRIGFNFAIDSEIEQKILLFKIPDDCLEKAKNVMNFLLQYRCYYKNFRKNYPFIPKAQVLCNLSENDLLVINEICGKTYKQESYLSEQETKAIIAKIKGRKDITGKIVDHFRLINLSNQFIVRCTCMRFVEEVARAAMDDRIFAKTTASCAWTSGSLKNKGEGIESVDVIDLGNHSPYVRKLNRRRWLFGILFFLQITSIILSFKYYKPILALRIYIANLILSSLFLMSLFFLFKVLVQHFQYMKQIKSDSFVPASKLDGKGTISANTETPEVAYKCGKFDRCIRKALLL